MWLYIITKIINGIATGTGDGATYTSFNLAINSWQGVGFVYSNALGPSICNLVIDNRTGNLKTNGSITSASITSGNITCSSLNDTGSIYMNNASLIYLKSATDISHYIKYDSAYDGPVHN